MTTTLTLSVVISVLLNACTYLLRVGITKFPYWVLLMFIEITVWRENITISTEKALLALRMIWNISQKEWIINYSFIFLMLLKFYPNLVNWTKNSECTEEKRYLKKRWTPLSNTRGIPCMDLNKISSHCSIPPTNFVQLIVPLVSD